LARFVAEILGLASSTRFGPFMVVETARLRVTTNDERIWQ